MSELSRIQGVRTSVSHREFSINKNTFTEAESSKDGGLFNILLRVWNVANIMSDVTIKNYENSQEE